MNVQQFETALTQFYIEFGYTASGQLPNSLDVPSFLSRGTATDLDALAVVIQEHASEWHYFVILSWRSLKVGRYSCSHAEYDGEIIPAAAIVAARNCTPPTLPQI